VEITAKEYTLEAEIKDMDIKQGIVTGYFSSFNTLDSDNDIILPNAFKRSIDNNGPESSKPRIKHLLNHDYTQPLGELLVLREDTKGLYYESKVGIHNLGVDFLKMVDSNLIKEHSIGFQITKWEKADKDGCRYLKELKLWEGSSLTAWGANEDTPMCGVKSIGEILQRQGDLTKAIANGTFTDETIKLLCSELERINKFLQEAFKSYGTTHPERNDATTDPNDEKELLIELQSINKLFKSFDNNGNKRSIG
jgi:HK97 family phage prohead protease